MECAPCPASIETSNIAPKGREGAVGAEPDGVCWDSGQAEPKMVDFENRPSPAEAEIGRQSPRYGFGRRRPERSVPFVREHRKHRRPPFAGRPDPNIETLM